VEELFALDRASVESAKRGGGATKSPTASLGRFGDAPAGLAREGARQGKANSVCADLEFLREQTTDAARPMDMQYRCIAASPTGFVQQLAVQYLAHGYWFYVQGQIPADKDPLAVDAKLLAKYGISLSRQSRARRKAVGIANLHYLRFERTFVLVATHGHHPFFDEESANIRDARRFPIKFMGYSIGVQRGGYLRRVVSGTSAVSDHRWRARVQIGREKYQELKAYFVDVATRLAAQQLAAQLFAVPFEPYARVRQQMLNIVRLVNVKRRAGGLEPIGSESLRYARRIVKPFDTSDDRPPAAPMPKCAESCAVEAE
jgi:hypothetical protein